jgi:hypothetical protein
VRVRLYNQSRLEQKSFETIVQIANRIWAASGVVIQVATDSDAIHVVVFERPSEAAADDASNTVVGTTIFVNGHATPNIRLSLTGADHLAEYAGSERRPIGSHPQAALDAIAARVLGVALAHELAHYLLDTTEHSSQGLLRAHFSVHEMETAQAARLSLTCAQRHVLSITSSAGGSPER